MTCVQKKVKPLANERYPRKLVRPWVQPGRDPEGHHSEEETQGQIEVAS
jgi:hypothetical protein